MNKSELVWSYRNDFGIGWIGRMKKISCRVIVYVLCASFLSACSGYVSNQDTGTAAGAVVGGVVGSLFGKGGGKIVGVIFGSAVGAYVGSNIGRQMDEQDRQRMSYAFEHQRDDQVYQWENPNTGVDYRVEPTQTYYSQQENTYCRKYNQSAMIDGKQETITGTACRQSDGTWKIVSADQS